MQVYTRQPLDQIAYRLDYQDPAFFQSFQETGGHLTGQIPPAEATIEKDSTGLSDLHNTHPGAQGIEHSNTCGGNNATTAYLHLST